MIQGFSTIDLANALADAHRDEVARALRNRPGPASGLRAAIGRGLIHTGLRMMRTTASAA